LEAHFHSQRPSSSAELSLADRDQRLIDPGVGAIVHVIDSDNRRIGETEVGDGIIDGIP
jgi:hypothetical protein